MWIDQDVRTSLSPQCSKQIATPCMKPEDCPKDFECSDVTPDALARMDPATKKALVCIQEPCTCRPVTTNPAMLPPGFRLPCKGDKCCTDGKGPAVCPPQLAQISCGVVKCGDTAIGSCEADGCNGCNIKVTGKNGKVIDPANCRLPLNESAICPGVVCPPASGAPQCGPRPSQCPNDWKLRCIRDPCVCTRSIWVDEDLRIAEPACTTALQPQCASSCPTQFSCPGLNPPLRCIQEPCTCRPIVDPASIPQMQPGGQMMQPGQPGGQMGQPGGQMGQPGQMQPGQMQPGQTRPGQMQPGQMQPGQMQPGGQMRPVQPMPGQMMPGQPRMPPNGQMGMPPGR
jgi:hypothetical protein